MVEEIFLQNDLTDLKCFLNTNAKILQKTYYNFKLFSTQLKQL